MTLNVLRAEVAHHLAARLDVPIFVNDPGRSTVADDLTTEVVPDCAQEESCYNSGSYGAAIFHPGHGVSCPRRVPNVTSFCATCGAAVNYRLHATWCPRAHVGQAGLA